MVLPASREWRPWIRQWIWLGFVLSLIGAPGKLCAQELEPRAYSVSPVSTNFLLGYYTRSSGSVLMDTSLPVTDVTARIDGTSIGYVRTFGLAGRLASIGVVLPYFQGDMTGNVGGAAEQVTRSGPGDSRLRFVVNLAGGPALTSEEFAQRPPATVLGTSLTVVTPTGEYDPARLINIGSNRWSFKPEIGLSHPAGNWFLEAALGVWLFTDNSDFFGGQRRSQDPVYTTQGHVSYTFRSGLWLSADATFYRGGRTSVDGVDKADLQQNSRYGLALSVPLSTGVSVKLDWSRGLTTRIGGNFDTFGVALQYRWFDL